MQHPSELGPRVFSGAIAYRLMVNSIVVWVTAPAFDDPAKVMTHQRILVTYGVVLGVCVNSLAAAVCSMRPEYRNTFVGSMSGRQYWRNYWQSNVLHESHQSIEAQRVTEVLVD